MARRDFFKRTQRKRYKAGRYRNPYFQNVKKIPWKPLSAVVGTLVVILLGLNLMFSSPRLAIQNVQIKGVEHIDPAQIEQLVQSYLQSRALLIFKTSNQFLFSSEELSTELENAFALANVSMGQSGGILTITIAERTSNLIWESGQGRYVVDLEGVVTRSLGAEEDLGQPLPTFSDTNNLDVSVGDIVMTPEEIENVFAFLDQLEAQGITYDTIRVDRLAGKWMSVETTEGFEILFDSVGDISTQASHLETVLLDQVEDRSELEYIDVRFGDHVYYK